MNQFKMKKMAFLVTSIFLLCLIYSSMIFAKNIHNRSLNYTIESTFQPVILKGKALNAMTNESISHIKVYKKLNSELHLVTYQIDQRDENGIYILNEVPDKNALFALYSGDPWQQAFPTLHMPVHGQAPLVQNHLPHVFSVS